MAIKVKSSQLITELMNDLEQEDLIEDKGKVFNINVDAINIAISRLQAISESLCNSNSNYGNSLEALNKAKDGANILIAGIDASINKLGKTIVKVDMTDECNNAIVNNRTKIIEGERQLLENHKKDITDLLSKHRDEINELASKKGVFISQKLFNIYYWIFWGVVEINILLLIYCVFYL